ncbi:MAG: restriction endonuclease subunit S [Anaeroplasmataceae bacterium]|nr:restriction endonuclease subunit S [Anaeroplasmataceae bacterium]
MGVKKQLFSILMHKRDKTSKNLNELIKSRFIEMFIDRGYPYVKMLDVSIGKAEYGAGSASIEYDPKRPRYVRITDINDDGTLNDDCVSSINVEDDEQYKLEYGDFMFARMGATVGKTYAFYDGYQIFAGYLIRFKLNLGKINPKYLFWYTKIEEYIKWIKENQSGAAQPGINSKKYAELRIPCPPIELQNEFALFVQQIDKSKFIGYSRYFLCEFFTLFSSTIAYSSVVSILA